MILKEIDNEKIWNDFVITHGPRSGAFLESYIWGKFQKKFGRKIWRLGFYKEENLKAITLIVKHNLPLGKNYLYCPRGPIFGDNISHEENGKILNKILELAKKEESLFFRFDPPQEKISNTAHKARKTKSIQPEETLILNLSSPEEEILGQMHRKTRYNIRVSKKHGVEVRKLKPTRENFEIFWKLLEETSERDKFSTHPKKYYKKMIDVLGENGLSLFIASYKNKPLAGELVMFFGDTATYLHGASSKKNREVMAPYAIHWKIIQEAKRENVKYYDFWGIGKNKWPGVTRFKKGFGGEEISYPGTYEIPISKLWYVIYKFIKKIK